MKSLWTLFCVFFKIGLFTFGGGSAMLPLLKNELVIRRKWAKDSELLDYYSIGQCTPGIIAVNVATFIGRKRKGKIGGCVATLGMIMPSFVIIGLIATILDSYSTNVYVEHAFVGIRIAVTALIVDTLIDLWKKGINGKRAFLIFAVSVALLFFVRLSAVWVVVFAALSGLIFQNKKCRISRDGK